MSGGADARAARRNRWVLLGIAGVAVVPLVAAYWLYHASRAEGPWSTTNRGALVEPHLALDDLDLTSADDQASPESGRLWQLLAVSEGDCAGACASALHQLKQLHVLLNKDASRVRRVLAFAGPAPEGRIAELKQRYPELHYALLPTGRVEDGVFIVDPLGNLVLYYRFDQAGRPMLDDLKRLLRISQIG